MIPWDYWHPEDEKAEGAEDTPLHNIEDKVAEDLELEMHDLFEPIGNICNLCVHICRGSMSSRQPAY